MCIFVCFVLLLTSLPPGKNTFADQLNKNKNNIKINNIVCVGVCVCVQGEAVFILCSCILLRKQMLPKTSASVANTVMYR
jgi:hypothetical protein